MAVAQNVVQNKIWFVGLRQLGSKIKETLEFALDKPPAPLVVKPSLNRNTGVAGFTSSPLVMGRS
ncbi:MAG TPA: hypothetical protein ENI77_02375 [Nitrospirae bacterium]|nr:hypothetical protein [Nitrospirota bacterium]